MSVPAIKLIASEGYDLHLFRNELESLWISGSKFNRDQVLRLRDWLSEVYGDLRLVE